MSKAVRIRDYLYDEIERLAKVEHRTLIAQLEVLLEQALRLNVDAQPRDVVARTVSGGDPPSARQVDDPPDQHPHFKPDFK